MEEEKSAIGRELPIDASTTRLFERHLCASSYYPSLADHPDFDLRALWPLHKPSASRTSQYRALKKCAW
jgi:hypothetical protein